MEESIGKSAAISFDPSFEGKKDVASSPKRMDLKMTVLGFRQKTYCAKSFRVHASGLEIILSGTLDGMIDMAIIESHGKSLTYSIEPTEARQLADKLCAAASDVTQHCLYDNDALLTP